MEKKNILFIIPWLPYPMVSGGHQALYNGILAIKNDFNVYVVYEKQIGNDEAEEHFREFFPNAVLLPFSYCKMSLNERIASLLHALIRKLFRERMTDEDIMCNRWVKTISPHKKEFVMHIDKVCHTYNFDIIQVEMPWLISLVLSLPKQSKRIYVHHEVGFVCRELEKQTFQNNIYVDSCKAYADLNEVSLLNMYDKVITLSPIDREKLLKNGVVAPISTSFAVVNFEFESNVKYCDGNHLTFVGPDGHLPNLVGILWFLENCWDMIKEKSPQMHLSIIGKWSDAHMQEISSKYKDVDFLGFVDNLQECLQGTIMIVPITIGSGIRMKILEACSMGVPFVCTSVGAEGIPVSNGETCFLADTPELFVEGIIKLKNKEIQDKFIKNAKRLVLEHYSLDSLRKNRIAIYEDM